MAVSRQSGEFDSFKSLPHSLRWLMENSGTGAVSWVSCVTVAEIPPKDVGSGTAVAWNNPDSGNHGTVTPVRTYQQTNGTYCREFEQTVTVEGKTQTGYGTACRQQNGAWEIQQQ